MYLSGIAGTVYVDDSFEFVGVPPGLHTVTKFSGTTANPQGALVVVGDQDVSDVKLRVYDLIPADIERDAPRAAGNLPPGPLAFFSLNGRVVDADSGMPITDGGAIRLWGYRNSSKAFALDGVGEFRVRELLPGSYRIEIQLAGYQPYTASVSIDQVAADATFPVQRSSGR